MKVRFTLKAEEELIQSYLYGCAHFGMAQADRYEADLRKAFDILADNPRLAAERPEYRPPVRIHHHAKHYIIYRIEDDGIRVIRLLRDESDLTRHLSVDEA